MEQVGELTACQAVPEAMELHRQNTMCINLTAPPYRVIGLVTKESTLPCNVPVSHLFKTYLPMYMNDKSIELSQSCLYVSLFICFFLLINSFLLHVCV